MSIQQQPDLTTVAGVLDYLARTPAFASDTVQLLSGGFTNFVYRAHLSVPYEHRPTVVLKYAAPYIRASALKMPLAVERQVRHVLSNTLSSNTSTCQMFEVSAMKNVQAAMRSDTVVTVSTIHHFDIDAHVMTHDHGRLWRRGYQSQAIDARKAPTFTSGT